LLDVQQSHVNALPRAQFALNQPETKTSFPLLQAYVPPPQEGPQSADIFGVGQNERNLLF